MKYKVEYMFLQLRATLLNFILDKINETFVDGGFTKPTRETDWIELMTVIYIQNKEENDRNLTSEINKYSQMTADVNRAFLLFCSSKVNYYLMYNNTQGALHFARIASIAAFYTLKDTDPHYYQVLINLEYSLQFAQKIMTPDSFNEMVNLVKVLKTKQMNEGINKKY